MGVDLNFIGTGISSGTSHTGFGGIVSNFVPAGSFPPAGSYFRTLYGIEYPIELGGASFASPIDSSDVPSQTCDVDELYDGSGGTYLDASSVTNINYVPDGTLFATGTDIDSSQSPVEVPSGSGNYYDSEFSYTYYYHDGEGDYRVETDHWQYFPYNTSITEDYSAYQLEVPSGSGNYFGTGKYDEIAWNGTGGTRIKATNQGSFYSSGTQITLETETVEVPSGGDSYATGRYYRYNWNGTGGYVGAGFVGSYYPNGTYIWDDGTDGWYWDGTGGYYSEPL